MYIHMHACLATFQNSYYTSIIIVTYVRAPVGQSTKLLYLLVGNIGSINAWLCIPDMYDTYSWVAAAINLRNLQIAILILNHLFQSTSNNLQLFVVRALLVLLLIDGPVALFVPYIYQLVMGLGWPWSPLQSFSLLQTLFQQQLQACWQGTCQKMSRWSTLLTAALAAGKQNKIYQHMWM